MSPDSQAKADEVVLHRARAQPVEQAAKVRIAKGGSGLGVVVHPDQAALERLIHDRPDVALAGDDVMLDRVITVEPVAGVAQVLSGLGFPGPEIGREVVMRAKIDDHGPVAEDDFGPSAFERTVQSRALGDAFDHQAVGEAFRLQTIDDGTDRRCRVLAVTQEKPRELAERVVQRAGDAAKSLALQRQWPECGEAITVPDGGETELPAFAAPIASDRHHMAKPVRRLKEQRLVPGRGEFSPCLLQTSERADVAMENDVRPTLIVLRNGLENLTSGIRNHRWCVRREVRSGQPESRP